MLVKLRRLSAATTSEDELGLKWDRCVADLLLKTGVQMINLNLTRSAYNQGLFEKHIFLFVGAGFGIGLVFSLMLKS